MERKGKILVGMSGGVDSCVAAARLCAQGFDVEGVTLRLWEGEENPDARWQDRSCCKVGIARYVADRLKIPHHVIDVEKAFEEEIVQNFTEEYLSGRTPNPCVRCNERIKFGYLIRLARDLGADYLATGHYARVRYDADRGRFSLFRGLDSAKDQSYFLYRLSQDQLSRVLFPLGEMKKSEVFQEAEALGLPPEEIQESQEICFVTQKDYRAFLEERCGEDLEEGEIVTEEGEVLSRHGGLALYTVGQRRGLGIAAGRRLYVTRLDPALNRVVVGDEESLLSPALTADDLNYVSVAAFENGMRVGAKVRYRTPEQPARVECLPPGRLRLIFETPQRAVSPGQSVVLYEGDRVLGGGIIQS